MPELEQYKKAYATLVGHVDAVIDQLKETESSLNPEKNSLRSAAEKLEQALLEAEEIIVGEDE